MKKKRGSSPSLIDLVRLWLEDESLPFTLTESGVLHRSNYQSSMSMWPIGSVESDKITFLFESGNEDILAVDPEFFDKLRKRLSDTDTY